MSDEWNVEPMDVESNEVEPFTNNMSENSELEMTTSLFNYITTINYLMGDEHRYDE